MDSCAPCVFSGRGRFLPLALGALTAALQILLLRRFLWEVEATEVGVGLFLAAWLAWAGVGAALSRTKHGMVVVAWLSGCGWLGLLVYAPLAWAQMSLLDAARPVLGVAAYAACPLPALALASLAVNAPVSLATGFLFPAASLRLARFGGRAPERAYAWESLGAALGGALLTVLLAVGVPLEGDGRRAWRRAFPRSRPDAAVVTPRARYLMGQDGGSYYALAAGGAVDTLPEAGLAPEMAALPIAQRPDATRILLVGEAPLSLAAAFRDLLPRAAVTWRHVDPAFARAFLARVAERVPSVAAVRVEGAARPAAETARTADIVVLWPPPPSGVEGSGWLDPVRLDAFGPSRFPRAVVAVPLRLSGGGADSIPSLRRAGAVLAAVRAVWPVTAVVAGAGGWVLAADREGGLRTSPEDAAAGFRRAGVRGFPAGGLADLYAPERAAVLAEHASALAPARATPGTIRAAAFREAWQREYPAGQAARLFEALNTGRVIAVASGLPLAIAALAVVLARRADRASRTATAAWFGASGALGLVGLLALMDGVQERHGALYLLAGLCSASYLCGLFTGNALARRSSWTGAAVAAPACLGLQTLSVAAVLGLCSATEPGATTMIGLAAVPGLATGLAAPVAAARLRTQGAAENGIAARVANADAIGSAAAGLLFALMLSPLLGHWAAWPIALSAAVLAGLCACPARRVRSAAVLVCGLAVAGIGLAVWLPGVRTAAGAAAKPAPPAPAATPAASRPVVPLPPGNLSDHTAEFWEPE